MTQNRGARHYAEGTRPEIDALPHRSLPAMLREAVADGPSAIAFTQCMPNGMNGSLRFAEVDRLADEFAVYLRRELLRLHPMNARTVGLETGIQNGPLAIGSVILTFGSPLMEGVLLIPVLYSLFIVIVATFVTLYSRRANLAEEQRIPSLL